MHVPSQSSPYWESSGACTDTSSLLGTPSCSGVGVGELVATAASPRVAGPFTPWCLA